MKKILSILGVAGILIGATIPVAQAQTYELETVWEKHWSDYPQFFGTNHVVRGMDYNPITNHLVIASRNDNAVHLVDATDGTYIGELDMTGVSGGTFVINKVRVATDGVIYVGNLTTDSTGTAFNLYRWADEDAVPVRVYTGNPGGGAPDNRWGDAMDLRGTGAETEILLGSYNGSMLVVLRPEGDPDAPDSYAVQQISTEVAAMAPRNVAFGPDDLVYVTRPGASLYELKIDFTVGSVVDQREFDGSKVAAGLSPIDYGEVEDVVAGFRPGPHDIWVYRRTHLSTQWLALPIATIAFTPPDGGFIDNGNATGDVVVVGDIIYGLNTNNGILAAQLVEGDPPPPMPTAEIFWSNNNEIRGSLLDGDEARTVIGGLARPIGLAVDAAAGHIYWAEDGTGRIGRANLDGSEPETVVDGLTTPQDVLVLNGRVYFSQYSHGLFSVDLEGGDWQPVLEVTSEGTSAIAYDEVIGKIYMAATSSAGAKLYSVNPDGTEPDVIEGFGTNYYGIAFDPEGTLFRANFGLHTVDSYDLGSGVATPLFDGFTQPLQIDVSDDGLRISWTERGNGGNVYVANADGVGEPVAIATGEDSPFGVTFVKSVTVGDGFADWIATFDLPEGERGAGDDPDGDGIDNLLEYALGGNPAVANRDLLPVIGVESEGDSAYLSIGYSKNALATGIDYVVEVSADLVNWDSNETNPGATVMVLEDAGSAIVRDATPISDANRRFIRLRIVER